MKEIKYVYLLLFVATCLVVIWILVPRTRLIEQYRHPSFSESLPPLTPRYSHRIEPQQQMAQRIWIPNIPITTISMRTFEQLDPSSPPTLTVREDVAGQPGTEIAQTSVATINHPIATLSLNEPIPVSNTWIWIFVDNPTNNPLNFVREVDSTTYQGGQLRIQGIHSYRDNNGVLSFTLAGPQRRWIVPVHGVVLVAILLALWTVLLGPSAGSQAMFREN